MSIDEISNEIKRRRTFAIISHPYKLVADKSYQHATISAENTMIIGVSSLLPATACDIQ